MAPRTVVLTVLALIAFAGNSILARMALVDASMGAAPFTAVRLASGGVVLALIIALRMPAAGAGRVGRGYAPIALFFYAAGFSFAYLSLPAGTGALVLFAAVQLTMLVAAWREGDRLFGMRALGLILALGGLVHLVSPSLDSPPLAGSVLMLAAGVAWGWYSLLGRGVPDPMAVTGRNFLLAAPLGLLLVPAALIVQGGPGLTVSGRGLTLAVVSGTVTSGLGYVAWYAALRGLTASRAATVQLTVPVLAAWGGVILLDEVVTLRLVVSAALILGGVALTLRRPVSIRP